tara:strand:+ start:529 stop:741 length:213 start_codon:yes stop_codon:yes gene_type:complete
MIDVNSLAKNKIEAKCFALLFERKNLHSDLAMGLSSGVSIREGYDVLDKLSDDLKVYEYILKCLNKKDKS